MRSVRGNPAIVVALVALFLASTGGAFAAGGALISGSQIKAHSIPLSALTPAAIRALRGKLGPRTARPAGHELRPVEGDGRNWYLRRCAARPDRRRHRRLSSRCGRARRRRNRQRRKIGVVAADRFRLGLLGTGGLVGDRRERHDAHHRGRG